MKDTSKLNNYHFGRHVFDYFPWYSYDNNNIYSNPKVDSTIYQLFNFTFTDNKPTFLWNVIYNSNSVTIGGKFYDRDSLNILEENEVSYFGTNESVNDWEDIEKIRLRCILGTRAVHRNDILTCQYPRQAEEYLKVIDFYKEYHDLVSDMVYTQVGEDSEICIGNINDFIQRDNFEVCRHFISDESVIKCLKEGKFRRSDFLDSVYKYYNNKGYLTSKQIEAVIKILYKEILSKKNITFFYVKTNRIKNTKRVSDYFKEIGLSVCVFSDFMLVYNKK